MAKLAAVQVLFHRSHSVWCWLQAVGKTSFTQRPAVPLACSCFSPVVASVLNCGQTTACDSLSCVTWEKSELWLGCRLIWIGHCLEAHMQRKWSVITAAHNVSYCECLWLVQLSLSPYGSRGSTLRGQGSVNKYSVSKDHLVCLIIWTCNNQNCPEPRNMIKSKQVSVTEDFLSVR